MLTLPPILTEPAVVKALVLALVALALFNARKMAKRGCGCNCGCPGCVCHSEAGSAARIKLTYFPLPGRAEPIRVALKLGKIPFADERTPPRAPRACPPLWPARRGPPSRPARARTARPRPADLTADEWKERKGSTPYGQLPVLYVDGEPLAQSLAIFRYVSLRAGLYPCGVPPAHFMCAKADEVVFLMDEVYDWLKPTYTMEADEQVAARKALLSEGSPIAKIFARLDARLAANRDKGSAFLVANRLTVADVSVFCMTAMLSSGWLAGIDRDFLRAYPHVRAHKAKIAQLPRVREHYAHLSEETAGAWRKAGIDVGAYQQ